MDYEWDETKRLSNIAKHGSDFLDSDLVFEAIPKVTIGLNYNKETRYADFAEVNGCVLKLVYILRGKTIRCISRSQQKRKEPIS